MNLGISAFLSLLDDYRVRGMVFEDVQLALDHRATMARFLSQPYKRAVFEGMDDFLAFSQDLDDFLLSLDSLPVLRGLVWLYFGYWYGGAGERIRTLIEWLLATLARTSEEAAGGFGEDVADMGANDFYDHSVALVDTIRRLTDPRGHLAIILVIGAGPLRTWLASTELQRLGYRPVDNRSFEPHRLF